MTTIFS